MNQALEDLFIQYQDSELFNNKVTESPFSKQDLLNLVNDFACDQYSISRNSLISKIDPVSIPFIIFNREVISLRDDLLKTALNENDVTAAQETLTLFDKLKASLADTYLDNFIASLGQRNELRLHHIEVFAEKNLLSHFESHLRWMVALTQAVTERNADKLPELDHSRCTFGRWLNNEGRTLLKDSNQFLNIYRIHESLHNTAQGINYILQNQGQSLNLYAQLQHAEYCSLDLGNEISMMNSIVIMDVYSKDQLTGLLTRRSMEHIIINQLEISCATEIPFCLMMLDLDDFKKLNDSHGHIIGDQALAHFAHTCINSMRQVDLMFRYGGEEFIILLPSTSLTAGHKVAENILCRLNNTPLEIDVLSLTIQASIGLYEVLGKDYLNIEREIVVSHLIKQCDTLLYQAKDNGKNQVVSPQS